MTSSLTKLAVGVFMSCLMAVSHAQEVESRWRLRVMDVEHQVKVDATIRFTAASAVSCMGGTWKRIVVEATTAGDEKFFPLAEPLAHEVERGYLTLGRTGLCDGYLFLSGKSAASSIDGTYSAFTIPGMPGGSERKLGYFSLKKID